MFPKLADAQMDHEIKKRSFNNNGSPSFLDRLALQAIGAYKKFLSPRKGYRCAHAALHNGQSCSNFAQTAILQHGIWPAIFKINQRFVDCNSAFHVLNSQNESSEINQDRNDSNSPSPNLRLREPCNCHLCCQLGETSIFGCGNIVR